MGSSESTIHRLDVPLRAQSNPFLATDNGTVSEVTTSLRIKPPRDVNSKIQIFDALTNELVFSFKEYSRTSGYSLQTPSGRVLMSLKVPGFFHASQRVYDGDQMEKESFPICAELHSSTPSVIYATFQDRLAGDTCRVTLEGQSFDDVVLIYLERGYRNLRMVDKHDDRSSSRYQPIARIHQKNVDEHLLEVASGVDVTLVLLLWHKRYEIEYIRQHSD